MRFFIKPRTEKKIYVWKAWFAWYPVRIRDNQSPARFPDRRVWLTTIERKRVDYFPYGRGYKYRERQA